MNSPFPYLSIKEAANRLGVRARDISDAIYQGHIGQDYPVFNGRRVIPREELEELRKWFQEREKKG